MLKAELSGRVLVWHAQNRTKNTQAHPRSKIPTVRTQKSDFCLSRSFFQLKQETPQSFCFLLAASLEPGTQRRTSWGHSVSSRWFICNQCLQKGDAVTSSNGPFHPAVWAGFLFPWGRSCSSLSRDLTGIALSRQAGKWCSAFPDPVPVAAENCIRFPELLLQFNELLHNMLLCCLRNNFFYAKIAKNNVFFKKMKRLIFSSFPTHVLNPRSFEVQHNLC